MVAICASQPSQTCSEGVSLLKESIAMRKGVKEEQGMWGMRDRASAACVATNVGPVPLLKDAGPCHGREENSEATSGDSASLGPALVDCYRSATPSPNMLG